MNPRHTALAKDDTAGTASITGQPTLVLVNVMAESRVRYSPDCELCERAYKLERKDVEAALAIMKAHPKCQYCTILQGPGHVETRVQVHCDSCERWLQGKLRRRALRLTTSPI